MFKRVKWVAKEAALRVKYMTSSDCLFCKIVRGEMSTKLVFETDTIIAFNDINPVAKVHILIVPKKHIESVETIKEEDATQIIEMFKVAQKLVTERKLDAYRLAFNGGKYQHVPHLHMHLLAGGTVQWSKL
jgi:histidine triad (HIT) family protein